MSTLSPSPVEDWVRDLPYSKMALPSRAGQKAKYAFWRIYTPLHPTVRNVVARTGIRRKFAPQARQRFLLGTLAPNVSVRNLAEHLVARGWGNHFVAWRDQGEVVSLRYVEDFTHQYHLRIFKDGEVRGHYEYTPECYPLMHLRAVDQQDRRAEFFAHLGDLVVPAPHSPSQ